jgi:hypothetical protein
VCLTEFSTAIISSVLFFFLKTFWNTKSDPEFGWRGVCWLYQCHEKMFRNAILSCVLLRKNFWNGVPAQKYPWFHHSWSYSFGGVSYRQVGMAKLMCFLICFNTPKSSSSEWVLYNLLLETVLKPEV